MFRDLEVEDNLNLRSDLVELLPRYSLDLDRLRRVILGLGLARLGLYSRFATMTQDDVVLYIVVFLHCEV